MTEQEHEQLIRALAQDLHPTRTLRPPWLRALAWLACCATLIAALLAIKSAREAADIRESLAIGLALLTAACAAVATLSLAIPGRAPAWAWLPAPPFLTWLAACGWDCWNATETAGAPAPMSCFGFILGVSLPLAALLYALLRRTFCVHPRMTAALAGLAAGSAAAATLAIYHVHTMPPADLVAHFAAILLVVAISRLVLPAVLAP